MQTRQMVDMTHGSITRLLIRFAIPMLIGNLFQQAYNLGDSMIVGHFLGSDALAAVGATGSVTFLFFSICNGVGSGCGVVTAQSYGSGDAALTRRAIANAAYIMFAAALVMGLAAFLAAPAVLRLMGTHPDILEDATVYMRMSCLGVPLIAVYNYTSSMLRALGDSRTPLYFLIFSSLLNLGLDVLFVRFFHMGVFGAALATIIAQMISGAGCLIYALKCNPFFRMTRGDLQPDRRIIGKAVRIGLPMAFQWSLIAISSTGLQTFVNSFGNTDVVAAYTATNRIESLLHQPYGSISAAMATFSGQNYGARSIDRVKGGLKHGGIIAGVYTLLMMLLFQLFSAPVMHLFVKEEAVIAMGAQAMRLTSLFFPFLALIYLSRGVLNGVGDALFALINGVVEVICRIGLPLLIVLIPGVGCWSIWWTAGVTWGVSALFCLLRYASWRRRVSDGDR
ncbi:MAG: MATE family efflux transporter [Clostridia bacterium]|nr:MATE family efflux transporter [Clostridia bacterium]